MSTSIAGRDTGTREAVEPVQRRRRPARRRRAPRGHHRRLPLREPGAAGRKRYIGSAMADVFARVFAIEGEGPLEVEEIFTAGDRAVVRWLHSWDYADGGRGHVRGRRVPGPGRQGRREAVLRQGVSRGAAEDGCTHPFSANSRKLSATRVTAPHLGDTRAA